MADNFSNTNDNPSAAFNPGVEREGFSNHPHFDGIEQASTSETRGMAAGFGPAISRYVDTYDRSLRANPYLHIGLAGAGALVLGYLFGRATAPAATTSVRGMSDIEAAYDE